MNTPAAGDVRANPDEVTITPEQAHALALSGELSLNAAAAQCGQTIGKFRYDLIKHPDYARAKAEGLLRGRGGVEKHSVEELRAHPAVVAVVQHGASFGKAAKEHGVTSLMLNNWVKRAHPDFKSDRLSGRNLGPGVARKTATDNPDYVRIKIAIKTLANDLGVPAQALAKALLAELS